MIRKRLTSAKLLDRIICLTSLFLILFFGITIISYIFLPEGFLLNKNNATNFDTSSNLIISTIQIFFWNMLSGKNEIVCFMVGLLLMLIGAYI